MAAGSLEVNGHRAGRSMAPDRDAPSAAAISATKCGRKCVEIDADTMAESTGSRMKRLTIVAVVFAAFTCAACSSGDTDSLAETPATAATDGGQGCESPVETATIQAADFAFDPNCIELPPGTTTLAIENIDDTDHTFTMDEVQIDKILDPGAKVPVDVAAINEGVWPFRCTLHPEMTGFLTVQ